MASSAFHRQEKSMVQGVVMEGTPQDLLAIVKRRKLKWYGHVSRSSGLAKNRLARHGERGKKTLQTEKEVGRQYQGMDRPGVRQVPEGGGEQGKMEKLVVRNLWCPNYPRVKR